jgi:hypothetical protein
MDETAVKKLILAYKGSRVDELVAYHRLLFDGSVVNGQGISQFWPTLLIHQELSEQQKESLYILSHYVTEIQYVRHVQINWEMISRSCKVTIQSTHQISKFIQDAERIDMIECWDHAQWNDVCEAIQAKGYNPVKSWKITFFRQDSIPALIEMLKRFPVGGIHLVITSQVNSDCIVPILELNIHIKSIRLAISRAGSLFVQKLCTYPPSILFQLDILGDSVLEIHATLFDWLATLENARELNSISFGASVLDGRTQESLLHWIQSKHCKLQKMKFTSTLSIRSEFWTSLGDTIRTPFCLLQKLEIQSSEPHACLSLFNNLKGSSLNELIVDCPRESDPNPLLQGILEHIPASNVDLFIFRCQTLNTQSWEALSLCLENALHSFRLFEIHAAGLTQSLSRQLVHCIQKRVRVIDNLTLWVRSSKRLPTAFVSLLESPRKVNTLNYNGKRFE